MYCHPERTFRMTIALGNPRHNRMGFPQEMGTQHDK